MYLNRILKLAPLLEKKSHFLFGPRSTGKSALIAHDLKDTLVIDLLQSDIYRRLLENPTYLESVIKSQKGKLIVIDEVQRIPELLNEVHRLIEKLDYRFLLTGSSARKLKQKSVNLLAGRARQAELFPLIYVELPDFNLMSYLTYGGLPNIVFSDNKPEDLDAYVNTYLEQEIQVEAVVKKLPAFSRFLQLAALTSGNVLNYSSIANDVGVSAMTLREYYQILQDTFLGFIVPPWQKSIKRKPVATAKFYLFDLGVKNNLARIETIPEQSDLYGQAFEHFIAMELRAYLSYRRKRLAMTYWATHQGEEVDFLIGDSVAIEVKSSNKISSKHLKNLVLLGQEKIVKKFYLVSQDPISANEQNIHIMYWEIFLKKLWADEII